MDLKLLNFWECEWFKALHHLRDSVQMPWSKGRMLGLTWAELSEFTSRLKTMTASQYWRVGRLVAKELGEEVDITRCITPAEDYWAGEQLAMFIRDLELGLNPPKPRALAARREIWSCLIAAQTSKELQKACDRWAQLPDVISGGMQFYPENVLANAEQFLYMKANRRFPHSSYADDSRLDFLARGMAAVMLHKSPMTGIERLRNIEHGPGGPFWRERERLADGRTFAEARCDCWRCGLRTETRLSQIGAEAYGNGVRLFMQVAREKLKRRAKGKT